MALRGVAHSVARSASCLVVAAVGVGALSACSSLPAVDEKTGAYDRQTSTGSNIAHHTTNVQSINGEAWGDVMRFGPNGACTKPTGGGCQ